MIYIVTGLPGAAKTLYALNRVLTDPQLMGREVYYHGIDELKLPWFKVDPKLWTGLPDGAVIVIDEAWKIFPLRPTGSLVPPHIEALTEHRHRGFDFVLITQDATLIDAFVRKLAERHFHLKRPFGLDYAVVNEFHGVSDPGNSTAIKQALSTRFKHPKNLYGVYKSATIHAVKKRVPLKLFVLPLMVVLVVFLGYKVYHSLVAKRQDSAKSSVASSASGKPVSPPNASGSTPALPQSIPDYLDYFAPRLPNMPQSAPVYDKLVADVKDFPRIAACMDAKSKCWCYTQQGTRLDVRVDICRAFVRYGTFDAYKAAESANILASNNIGSPGKSVVNPQPGVVR